MTVAALPAVKTYFEDGASVSFAVPFRFRSASDLIVERLPEGGPVQLLTLGVDYTVAGGETDEGGTVTRLMASSGAMLRIRRETARAQQMVYATSDRFPAASHEEALDRAMLIAQEIDASVDDVAARAPLVPVGEIAPDFPSRLSRRGRFFGFDADGNSVALAGIGNGNDGGLREDLTDPTAGAKLVSYQGRSVEAKLGETVSITDTQFAGGAAETRPDNTAAIQAAIDAVAAAGGGTVEVPPGRFDFLGPLVLKERVRIAGKGPASRLHSTNTTRANGIVAAGASTLSRIAGLSVENIRLTSAFVRGGTFATGNAIRWLWVRDSSITNVWCETWSDSGVSITDSDRVAGANVNIKGCSQGYDVFNDSHDCTLNGLICEDTAPYVALNIEGLAATSTKRPSGFVGTNIRAIGFGTHGINLVNADRPIVSGWSASGGTGNAEGPGSGFEVYGCSYPVIGDGVAYANAGYGIKVGPSQDHALLTGVTTVGNGGGGLLVTDSGGATSLRVGVAGCKFMEGPPTLVGNASIDNVVQALTLQAATPMLKVATTSTTKRNAQILFASSRDADQGRIGWDLSTNDGTNIFQVYLDSYGGQIFGVQTDSVTGGNDNSQSLGRANRRFSTVFAGTGTINTSDATTKQQIGPIPDAWLDAWADVDWLRFKFNDAVMTKGESARWHTGLIAQRIRDAFEMRGLDATETGLLCYDEWAAQDAVVETRGPDGEIIVPASPETSAGSLWSVRSAECQAMEAALHRRELARLHARLDAIGVGHG